MHLIVNRPREKKKKKKKKKKAGRAFLSYGSRPSKCCLYQ